MFPQTRSFESMFLNLRRRLCAVMKTVYGLIRKLYGDIQLGGAGASKRGAMRKN